jgi:hypothetical protein
MSEQIVSSYSGESNARAKLTWEKVDEIRKLKGRLTTRTIAKKFRISRSVVWRIHQGKSWNIRTRGAKTKIQIATEFIRIHNEYSSCALARGLVATHPNVFSTIEIARCFVNRARGCCGDRDRKHVRDKSLFREPARLV